MTVADQAVQMFEESYNCAQAVLANCGAALGINRAMACRVAQGFGGGMGLMGLTCGAVAGAFMVIGLKHAKTSPQTDAEKQAAYQLVREFAARFKARNGSIVCRDLLGCDISTPDGMAQAREKGLFTTLCPKLVRDAAEIVEDLCAG